MSLPSDPSPRTGAEAITEAADRARERLRAEIARTRAGVEELLAEQPGGGDEKLRNELEALRVETRGIDDRMRALEQRLDAFEREREYAEWRIHKNTEAMLDGLLREIRYTADILTR
ncbi:MAG: hypothetical protein WD827_03735 [Solirubrobacterales bacterium]